MGRQSNTTYNATSPVTSATAALTAVATTPNGVAVAAARTADRIAVATKATAGAEPTLWTFTTSAANLTNALSDNPDYQGQGRFSQDLALSSDGTRADISTAGQGVAAVDGL